MRDGQRHGAQQGREGRHQDRPEALARGFQDGRAGLRPRSRSCLQREIHQHDAVLLDDADQQDDADERRSRSSSMSAESEARSGAEPSRRQGRDDG